MADNATVVSTSTRNFPNRLGKGRLPFSRLGGTLGLGFRVGLLGFIVGRPCIMLK